MFHFKHFSISDDKSSMKVGTDGVLLGIFSEPLNARMILDVGTGCGLIALMLAQKCNAKIDAIDIDENSCMQAQQNFNISPWKNRMNVINDDFVIFLEKTENIYDFIVSNPPFFIKDLRNSNNKTNLAKHCDTLNFDSLLKGVSKLLKPDGRFTLIIPCNRIYEFLKTASINKLHIKRILIVHSVAGKTPNRYIIELSRNENQIVSFSRLFIRNPDGTYTKEYKQFGKDYYLKFDKSGL